MHRDARALAGRVEARHDGAAPDVGVDAAHVVVRPGPDRDRLLDRVDARVVHRQLAGAVKDRVDLLGAEVGEVEQDAAVDAAALVDLGLLRARDDVARGQLAGVRGVLEHEPVALGVSQVAALAAAALGDEDAVGLERRRVKLHELHVLQRHARPPRHRHAVAGAGVGVRRAAVHAPEAARRQDDRTRLDALDAAVDEVPGGEADAALAVHHEVEREPLLVDRDLRLHELLVEDVQEHVAGDVGRVARARGAAGPERALGDLAVGRAREDAAHVLELVDVAGPLLAHDGDRILVAQVVGALDGEERVLLGRVLRRVAERGVDAALRGARMAARGMQLRDDGDVGAVPRGLDCGAHPGDPGTDHNDVVSNHAEAAYQSTSRGHFVTVL